MPIPIEKADFATLVPVRLARLLSGLPVTIYVLYCGNLNVQILAELGIVSHQYGQGIFSGIWGRYLALIWHVIRLSRQEQVDIFLNVWVHYFLFPIVLGARLTGSTVIARVAGMPIASQPKSTSSVRKKLLRWLGLFIEKQSLNGADYIYTLSHSLKQSLIERGIDKSKITILPQGVDCEQFQPAIHKNESGKPPRVLFVGRLASFKDLPSAIHAFRLVLDQLPGSEFVIIGEGQEKETLLKLVTELELDNHVFFKGYVPQSDLPIEYQQADVLILPSKSEGLPNVVLEAQSSGLPVVGTTVGEMPFLLAEGRGCLAEVGDIQTMAKHIVCLLSDQAYANKMRQKSRNFVQNNYSFEAVRDAHLQLFEQICN